MARGEDAIPRKAEVRCGIRPDPGGGRGRLPAPPDRRRGRKRKGKERALIERLKAPKATAAVLHDFSVPFDNNQAERDVRNGKTKTKVPGCFRTEAGAKDYLDITSFLSTGAKHGASVFGALTAAFAGNGKIVLT